VFLYLIYLIEKGSWKPEVRSRKIAKQNDR